MIPQRPLRLRSVGGLLLVGLFLAVLGVYFWWLHHSRAAGHALEEFRLEKAQHHLKHCLKVWPFDSETQFLAAQTARRLDDLDEAEQLLKEYERRHGHGPAIALERTLLRAQQGGVDEVKSSLYALVDKDDTQAMLVLEAVARGHMVNSRADLSLQALDKLLARHADHIPALFLRAGIYDDLGKTKEAVQDYERAVELEPEGFDARLRLADLFSIQGRVRDATYHYEWLRQVRPADVRVVVGLSHCLVEQQERDRAKLLLDELLALQPDDVPALVERARIDLRAGKPGEAVPLLRHASRLAPYDRDAFWVLHLCMELLGDKVEDHRCLEEVARIDADRQRLTNLLSRMKDDPSNLTLRYEAGVLMLRVGREEEGVRLLSDVVVSDPRHALAREALSEFKRRKSR